jgi:hypothetical protein
MSQWRNLRDAYSTTNREVHKIMKDIVDVLQKKQDTTMFVARNI